MNNTRPTEPQSFNTATGTLKSKLEAVGVKFVKSINGSVWYAEIDGHPVARHRELSICVKEAGKALGEI